MRYRQHTPIVITLPEFYPNEPEALQALVNSGIEIIHLRKPGKTEVELRNLLRKINPEIYPNLTIHYHPALAKEFGLGGVHLRAESAKRATGDFRKSVSCHNWMEVKAMTGHADYVFLSPIFDSVSKAGYTSAFTEEQLNILLKDHERPAVVALGGITEGNIRSVGQWGFEGAAAIGSVWVLNENNIDIEKSISNYRELKKAWNKTK